MKCYPKLIESEMIQIDNNIFIAEALCSNKLSSIIRCVSYRIKFSIDGKN